MKAHPILFNAESIKAILDGRKTQTRREIKCPPDLLRVNDGQIWKREAPDGVWFHWLPVTYSPYGQPGDHLWVRETWAASRLFDDLKPSEIYPDDTSLWYKAGGDHVLPGDEKGKLRSSIFMPRWASRITLEVSSVRVEQVQDISHADALAEGIDPDAPYNNYGTGSIYRDTFAELWDSINAKRGYGWNVNSWVWVLGLRKEQEA